MTNTTALKTWHIPSVLIARASMAAAPPPGGNTIRGLGAGASSVAGCSFSCGLGCSLSCGLGGSLSCNAGVGVGCSVVGVGCSVGSGTTGVDVDVLSVAMSLAAA